MTYAIEINGLRKRFGNFEAVQGVDLIIPGGGGCYGLLGPNGAGKTTTLEMIEGLQTPTSGEIKVLGRTWKKDGKEIRKRIGVQLQDTRFFDLTTVEETLSLFRSFTPQAMSVQAALELVQLDAKRRALVNDLSGGQHQRLALATALIGNPEILFLDEPTTGLDPQSRATLWDIVRKLKDSGRTVILTTHYMEEAEALCDHIHILDAGKILESGTPSELIAKFGGVSLLELEAEPQLSAEWFAPLAGITQVLRQGGAWRLSVESMAVALRSVTEAASARGVTIKSARTLQPTMNDVFLALTGRQLRSGDIDPPKP